MEKTRTISSLIHPTKSLLQFSEIKDRTVEDRNMLQAIPKQYFRFPYTDRNEVYSSNQIRHYPPHIFPIKFKRISISLEKIIRIYLHKWEISGENTKCFHLYQL